MFQFCDGITIAQIVNMALLFVLKEVNTMYATRMMTDIYHLVQPDGQHTLCGLRISRITSERKTNTLQLVPEVPNSMMICKHCERIRVQDLRLE